LYSPIFINIFLNQKLKSPSKFDFRLGFIDFDKIFFAMSAKYGNIIMVFFLRLLYYLFTEVIFEGPCFELKKSIFEVKHTCTF
jgi:hypothetical protein